ncbi:MAG: glutamate--tRNA ligase [Candidatus Doudnabacteria bacterium RIFCSPHIGHO2_02_FULL_49_24]|nr:MAG: glutamate--tRNA ligase [Candidatus Doudnabacteria bacterium RIFCSPHIGHO2_02_FULL_49_24]
MPEVRTRFAPSPTGFLHIGGIRTALYEFLWARKNNGKYLLRIEDTDRQRLVPGSLENIVQSLETLRIVSDEGPYWDKGLKFRGEFGPYIQSERLPIYQKYAQELIEKKAAYYCFCSSERLDKLREEQQAQKLPPKYDKLCLKLSSEEVSSKLAAKEAHVIRLNVPSDRIIKFHDHIHGDIEIPSKDVDDQVLLKSDGFPTYHLAVVVDDYSMKISHVIRADEWIASTPKHILLYEAFGWPLPVFVHLPAILSQATGKKLSKREGDVSVKDFLDKGYLPEALINFLALLGWNPKTEQEIFNMRELVAEFSLDKLNKSGAVFDLDKLDWFNSMYIRALKIEDLFARLVPYLVKAGIQTEKYPKEFLEKILLLEQSRLKKLSEIGERVKYFFEEPQYEPGLLCPPARKASAGPPPAEKKSEKETILKNLNSLQIFLQTLSAEKFAQKDIEAEIKNFIESNQLKTGEVLWPLRVALCGLEASPGPFEIIDAFASLPDGNEQVLKRISRASEMLF